MKWYRTVITDAGTPLGTGYRIGQQAWVAADGKEWIVLNRRERRWVTEVQKKDFTKGMQPEPDQPLPERLFKSMEPDQRQEIALGVAKYFRGLTNSVRAEARAVKEKDWEADWDKTEIEWEARVFRAILASPKKAEIIKRWRAHEEREHEIAYSMAKDRWPFASPADLDRLAVEMEGPAHAQTITEIDGFEGPDKEQKYYLQNKREMTELGFSKEVSQWPNGPTL